MVRAVAAGMRRDRHNIRDEKSITSYEIFGYVSAKKAKVFSWKSKEFLDFWIDRPCEETNKNSNVGKKVVELLKTCQRYWEWKEERTDHRSSVDSSGRPGLTVVVVVRMKEEASHHARKDEHVLGSKTLGEIQNHQMSKHSREDKARKRCGI